VADDGAEFATMNDCVVHEAKAMRAEYRHSFADERSKTDRSRKRIENMLMDYDVFCAQCDADGGLAAEAEEADERLTLIGGAD